MTPAQQQAWEQYWGRHLERSAAVFPVECDGGCGQVFVGTFKERRAAGWRNTWRSRRGTGVQDQVDLCPRCRG